MNIIKYVDRSQPDLIRRKLSSSQIYTLFYRWTFIPGAYNGVFYIINIPNCLAGLIPKCNRVMVKALYQSHASGAFTTFSGESISILEPSSINNINSIANDESYITTGLARNYAMNNNAQSPWAYELKNSKTVIPYDILLNNYISLIFRYVNTGLTYAGRNTLAQICLNFEILD